MSRRPDLPNALWPGERATNAFEKVVLSIAKILLMILIALSMLDLAYLMWHGVNHNLVAIGSVGELQKAMQRGFAGILLVMIGLELLETLRAYLHDRHVRLEVVLIDRSSHRRRAAHRHARHRTSGRALSARRRCVDAGANGRLFLIRKIASVRQERAISRSIPKSNPEDTQR